MQYDLAERLYQNGISKEKFKVNVDITPVTTTDPEVININYDSVLSFSIDGMDGNQYILPKVKVEVSGRSRSEPVSEIALHSMIDQIYPKAPFAEPKFMVRAVLPKRTFPEKVFLLHENPRFHLFGHIHASNGEKAIGATKFVNSAIVSEYYSSLQDYHILMLR